VSGSEAVARYDPGGEHGLGPSMFSHMALARVK